MQGDGKNTDTRTLDDTTKLCSMIESKVSIQLVFFSAFITCYTAAVGITGRAWVREADFEVRG